MKALSLSIAIIATLCCSAQTKTAQDYVNLAQAEKQKKAYRTANKYIDSAIAQNPSLTTIYTEMALLYTEQKQPSKVLEAHLKLEKLEPTNTQHKINLAQCFFKVNQYKKALDYAYQSPNFIGKDKIVGISLYRDENYGMAIKYLADYIKVNQQDADAAYYLANAYLEVDNYKLAIAEYEHAIKLDSTKNNWHNELGLIYYTFNKYSEAVKSFERAIYNGIAQTNDFKENLAFAYAYAGNTNNADVLFNDLIVRKNNSADFIREVAEGFYAGKRYDKALEYCSLNLQANKNDARTLYVAGLCFIKKGDDDRGKSMCDAAIAIDPGLAKMRKSSGNGQFGL
jgi:tetratricopeptide (TPR) repeat protein